METIKSTVSDERFYLDFFGLTHNPFPVVPDDNNFFVSKHIDQILKEIVHGVCSRKGFMVLTGDIGLGKTTISRIIIKILEKKDVETSLVFHTGYQDTELLNEINQDFGLDTSGLVFNQQSGQMKLLTEFLLEQNRQNKNCAIVIDDAQNLSFRSLEMVRMISNLETSHHKLVQIFMVGQPELIVKLNSKRLRQLKSRIIIKKEAMPLMNSELKNFLQFKLTSAGNSGQTNIHNNAIKLIYKITQGNFRRINVLMDRSLYVAYRDQTLDITKKIVKEAFYDLEPDESILVKKKKIKILSTMLVVCFLAGLACAYLYRDLIFSYADFSKADNPVIVTKPIPQRDQPIQVLAQKFQVPQVAGLGENKDEDTVPQKKAQIPKSITDFLESYQFSHYAEKLFKAFNMKQLKDISETIFKETGYQLIQLHKVTPDIQRKFGILNYPSPPDRESNFFLFWQPKLRIQDYFYRYQGKEIYTLQWILTQHHLYKDTIDGIVGKELTKAIIHYQESMGLDVTGYPDDNTVFMLFHTNGEMSQ